MTDLPPPPPPANAPPSRWPWLLAVAPLGVGAYLGYQVAYLASVGGLGGALGSAYLGYAIGGLVLVAILVGVANGLRAGGRGARASRYSFAAAGIVLAGAGAGWASVPVLDLGYHEPVVLQARGEASVILEGVPTFEGSASGRANCQSVVAGTDVGGVSALSLGDLDGRALRAGVSLPIEGAPGHVSLFVDAAHLPQGSVVPMWDTDNVEIEASSDRASGSIRFADAPIRIDPEMGAPAPSWPTSLSGVITWSCGPWFAEGEPGAPTVVGRITVELVGVEWTGTSNGAGTCDFEADGSVWTVTGDAEGLLQGEPLSLTLDLGGDPHSGDEVHLSLSVHLAPPSGASSLPLGVVVAATSGRTISWTDLVAIDEIAPDGLSGRLTFNDLPVETTPDPAWPASLSGELAWECG